MAPNSLTATEGWPWAQVLPDAGGILNLSPSVGVLNSARDVGLALPSQVKGASPGSLQALWGGEAFQKHPSPVHPSSPTPGIIQAWEGGASMTTSRTSQLLGTKPTSLPA